MEVLHICDGIRDPVVIVMAESLKVGVRGGWGRGWVVHEVFNVRKCAFVVVECRRVVIQCGHVTLLVRVGGVAREGDGCGEEGEWDVRDVLGCGVVLGWCAGVVVVTSGGHWWGMVGVGVPVPVLAVLVFGRPVVTVSELVFKLVCGLGGFLGLVVPEEGPLGLVSLLVDHPLELFELAHLVFVVYEAAVLVYLVSLVFESSVLVSVDFSLVSSFPVHLFLIVFISGPCGFVSIAFGLSVSVLESLGCVFMVHVVVVVVFKPAVIGFGVIGLAVVRVQLVLVVAVAVVTVVAVFRVLVVRWYVG